MIFSTIPFAGFLQERFINVWGAAFFSSVVVGAVITVFIVALAVMVRDAHFRWSIRYLWLAGVAGVYLAFILKLKEFPIEALHIVEYGFLGLLVFRALSHRTADILIYLSGAAICMIVGTMDEILQWIAPKRFWDFRDVWMNAVGGGLMQVAIGLGVRPSFVSVKRVAKDSVHRTVSVLIATVLLLGLCASNIPARYHAYTRLPLFSALAGNPQVMSEFGYLHHDVDLGAFYSRFSRDELRTEDSVRSHDAAAILDEFREERYSAFLSVYPSWRDPFVHEARVHLFRRDRYLAYAAGTDSEDEKVKHLLVVRAENLILERYFRTTLEASSYRLSEEVRKRSDSFVGAKHDYVSPVDRHLITVVTEEQIWMMIGLAVLSLLGVDQKVRRRAKDG